MLKDLIALRKFVHEHGWTQGSLARDSKGNVVGIRNRSAASFCLLGAIYRLFTTPSDSFLIVLHDRASISTFNDTPGRTKDEVLDLLDRVIAKEASDLHQYPMQSVIDDTIKAKTYMSVIADIIESQPMGLFK